MVENADGTLQMWHAMKIGDIRRRRRTAVQLIAIINGLWALIELTDFEGGCRDTQTGNPVTTKRYYTDTESATKCVIDNSATSK